MLSVAGADHIITMDLHASQIQVSERLEETMVFKLHYNYFRPLPLTVVIVFPGLL